MSKQGIIDLGSNTIRLVVYEFKRKPSADMPNTIKFKTLVNEKKVCGLSAYVVDDQLSDAGIEKAVDVVSGHLSIARNIDCPKVQMFATAVIRNRANCDEIVRCIEDAVGMPIDVISGEDESHLGFVGASLANPIEEGILIDIGGGSTEFTVVQDAKDVYNSSIDAGCVTAFADCVRMLIPAQPEMDRIRRAVNRKMDAFSGLDGIQAPTMYGIGGSVRAVGKMRAQMLGSEKAIKRLVPQDVEEILKLAEDDPSSFIHMAAKAVPDRMHTILTGCTILKCAMERFGTQQLQVCKYGIREGYLATRCF